MECGDIKLMAIVRSTMKWALAPEERERSSVVPLNHSRRFCRAEAEVVAHIPSALSSVVDRL
jgi:hypothetical protein